MKRIITYTYSTFAVLLLVAGSATTLFAQESDYETVQDFRSGYSEVVNWIDNSVSSSDLDEISNSISSLESDYSGHSELLNSALYPDTFSDLMDDLRSRYDAAEQNITTIEELNERVRELSEELAEFRAGLSDMDAQVEDLQTRLNRSESNARQLSGLVQQYRQSLENRDEFVAEFLEELLNKYETLDAQTASELAEAAESMDDNPIDLVKTILGDYINYTDQSTALDAGDYLRMKAQRIYFNEVWAGIGESLSNVYAPDRSVQANQEVTDLLSNWNASIENKLWSALTTAFSQNDIDLANFTSASAFYNALSGYVDSAVAEASESNREEDMERYRNFSSFWNGTVKGTWGEFLMNGEVLTYSQLSEIDQKLENWNEAAVPVSNLMLILFLVSLVVIIGLIVMLARKRGDA